MTNKELEIILERLYHLETAYKGFTTRLRLLEAEIDRLKQKSER
jgi:hypothetical protein